MTLKKELLQRPEKKRLVKLMAYERRAREQGYLQIAGVDEAGRGPLAGPVVAAACILPENTVLPGINDSKQLNAEAREALYQKIKSHPGIVFGVGIVESVMIDQINILRATLQAMVIAITQLTQKPDYILVDGNQMPPLEIPTEGIVDGDTLSQSIMAAAIIAKVTRDWMMKQYHEKWPHYGFADHKGYSTPQHLKALREWGPCPIHRKSFEPVRLVS